MNATSRAATIMVTEPGRKIASRNRRPYDSAHRAGHAGQEQRALARRRRANQTAKASRRRNRGGRRG